VLLRLGRHGGRRSEIEADAAELFIRRAGVSGTAYARRRYWHDVLSFYLPRRRSRLEHGPVHTESTREHGDRVMAGFRFDLRQVLRSIRRQPAFFAVAALTLGVGFAAHFAAFGVIDRLLLSPPAHVQHADRVFRLHVDRADIDGGRFLWFQTPYVAYQDFRRNARSFSAMAAYRSSRVSVGAGADARMISLTFADAHYFPLLGVSAARGRVFGPEDDVAPSGNPVLVLSDTYWRTAFGADDAAIGQTLRIGAQTFRVIGVAPPGFTGDTPEVVDAWAPLHSAAQELPTAWATHPLQRSVVVLTRLATGVSPEVAAEESAAAYRRASEGTEAADATARVVLATLLPGRTQRGELSREARIAVWLEGVSLLVLLVAIANVVNLQMSRAAQQRRELAVRVALGATRRRLLSKLALEMLIIAAGGVAAGIGLTYWSATTLHQLLLPGLPGAIDPWRFALVAGATMSIATAIVVGFAALQIGVEGVGERLKTGRGGEGFSRARLRQGLLVAQVVMSSMLLVGAGLFLRSITRVGELEFGMDNDRVLAITLPLRSAGYSAPASEAFYERALEELSAVPGVERAAAAHSTPFAPSQRSPLVVPGFDQLPFDPPVGYPTFYTVTPTFFQTMGVKILRGRGFTDADRAGAPLVVVVEAALAATLWPGQDPIGKCFKLGRADQPCREIVGVASNTRRFVRTTDASLRYYVPMGQRVVTAPPQALFVRAAGDPSALIVPVRAALLRVADNLPYAQIRVLSDLAEPETRPWRLGSTLFVIFGVAALFVATSGVYALLSVIVTQRSREIGVRLALGASPGRTLQMIVRQSMAWVAAGLVLGLAAALTAGRFIQPLLFETSPYDPMVFASTTALLLLVALAASLAPAVRASRVDPNVTLRAE
jgi:predicted permease